MGCDIHAFIEYKEVWGDREHWSNFGERFSERNYAVFGHLAGVRASNLTQVVPLRGVPEGAMAWRTEDAYYTRIADRHSEYAVTLEQAQSWGGRIDYNKDGQPYRTEGPDWHSASWCTPEEFAKVLGTFMLESDGYMYGVMWDAMLAAMKALQERGLETRLVYWFDN